MESYITLLNTVRRTKTKYNKRYYLATIFAYKYCQNLAA